MQKSLYLLPLAFIIHLSKSQEWTWLGGDKMADRNSADDHPGGRGGASVWVDMNGTMWMFGGNGFSDLPAGRPHLLNDVWKFNLNTTKFELQHSGSWTVGLHSSNISSETSNVPEVRQHAAVCGDAFQLFLFGGFGEGGALDDLWTYNTLSKKWLKMAGGSYVHVNEDVRPAARGDAAVWCHESFMYLFGGIDSNKTVFSDMWRFTLSSLQWTKLGDSLKSGPEGCDGVMGHGYPSGRNGAAKWISDGKFYMFGGNSDPTFSYTLQHTSGLTSDLWVYCPQNNTWQCVNATFQPHQDSEMGKAMKMDLSSVPGARIGAATWTDVKGNLWLFGGAGKDNHPSSGMSKLLSDIWRFDNKRQSWEFMGGSSTGEAGARYSELGKQSSKAIPGSRTDMMIWKGGDNLAYMFGGIGHDGDNYDGYLSDLWSVDVTKAVNHDHVISPLGLFLFLGVGCTALILLLILAMFNREKPHGHVNGHRLMLNAEYSRLVNDEP